MLKFLKPLMICPLCKGELIWTVTSENVNHITEAKIECSSCHEKYFIEDSVACFLIGYDKSNDNWQIGDDYLSIFFSEHPEIKYKLLKTPVEKLNAADLYTRASLLKEMNDNEEAERLGKLGYEKAYTEQYKNAIQSQIDYVLQQLKHTKGFVVDIASGSCTLVDKLLEQTMLDVIATDISFNIMKKAHNKEIKKGYEDRSTFIAFDAAQSPFRNTVIPIMTTFAGLQNILKPDDIVLELKRICTNRFYSISSFCPESDSVNKEVLEKIGIDKMWIKERNISEFKRNDWDVDIENSIIAEVKPTPMGEIVEGVGIDGIPVADSQFECCTVVYSIKEE
jgi:uncharacterized protein YbaR (Trm112 family)